MQIMVNGRRHSVAGDWQDETLLVVLREALGLVGSKYGCGAGQCGACTVIIAGEAIRSCQMPVGDVAGREVRTIEGLARQDGELHPVQSAWLAEAVPQCGYCQAGQILSAVALLERNSRPTDAEIEAALAGNLCRCGTYARIRRAVRRAAQAT